MKDVAPKNQPILSERDASEIFNDITEKAGEDGKRIAIAILSEYGKTIIVIRKNLASPEGARLAQKLSEVWFEEMGEYDCAVNTREGPGGIDYFYSIPLYFGKNFAGILTVSAPTLEESITLAKHGAKNYQYTEE